MADLRMEKRKRLGAFYTDERVAKFLVTWGLARSGGVVLDPSCGDGRFLVVAAEEGAARVIGCDADPEAVASARARLLPARSESSVIGSDFFKLDPAAHPRVDLIVGNPPFIRYQLFNGESRRRAQESARVLGVDFNGLAASWAPFLVHAMRFLSDGGALAMVVPAELVQTAYGLPVLRLFLQSFSRVRLLTFERNIFTEAQEETFLLLAERYGDSAEHLEIMHLSDATELEELTDEAMDLQSCRIPAPLGETFSFGRALLRSQERAAWENLAKPGVLTRMGDVALITNGYVSGANDFFHRTRRDAGALGLPPDWLCVSARSSRSLRGLVFTSDDVADLEAAGAAHHLVVPHQGELFSGSSDALKTFISEGEDLGVHRRYKCRSRSPWWKVPGLHVPDLLFPYMIASAPHASLNTVKALYTNSLHGIRLKGDIDPRLVALALLTTPALLSMEFQGRSYGGGVLKLEPSELRDVCVPLPRAAPRELEAVFVDSDSLIRRGSFEGAVEAADRLLVEASGISSSEMLGILRGARSRLVARRMARSRRTTDEHVGSADLTSSQ